MHDMYPLETESSTGLLVRLTEEMSEATKVICKIQRFGVGSFDPKDPKKTKNSKALAAEINDVLLIVSELRRRGLFK